MSNETTKLMDNIKMNIKYLGGGYPNWDNNKDGMEMHKYRLELIYDKRSYSFDFWCCATTIPEKEARPSLSSVLECLFSDADCVNDGYEYFCDEYAYERNTNSKKIFNDCKKIKENLERLFQKDFEKIKDESLD